MTKRFSAAIRAVLAYTASAFLGCALLGLGAVAQAQTQTVYATGVAQPANLSFDSTGALFSGEFSQSRVFRTPAGGGAGAVFTTAPGQTHYAVIGPDGGLYVTQTSAGEVLRYAPAAVVPDVAPYATGLPADRQAIAFDAAGRLFAVVDNNTNLWMVPPGGGVASVFGTGVGARPLAVALDAGGNIYALNQTDGVVRRVGSGGGAATVFSTGGGAASLAMAIHPDGRVFTADFFTNQIFVTSSAGGVQTPFYVSPPASGITSLAIRGGVLYAGNFNNATVYAISIPVVPVPTMSEWAMILFGLMLAGGAALYIQRRHLIA